MRSVDPPLALALLLTLLAGCAKRPDPPPHEPAAVVSEEARARARFFEVYRAGEQARRHGDRNAAERLFREALVKRPGHEGAVVALTRILRESGRRSEALSLLSGLRSRDPHLPRGPFLMAEILSEIAPGWRGDFPRAAGLYREALRLAPGTQGARLGLARTLRLDHRLQEAAREYRTVLATDPGSVAALRGLAGVHLDLGEPAEAVPLLVTALEVGTRAGGRKGAPSEMDTRKTFEKRSVSARENLPALVVLAHAARRLGDYPTSVPAGFRVPDLRVFGLVAGSLRCLVLAFGSGSSPHPGQATR